MLSGVSMTEFELYEQFKAYLRDLRVDCITYQKLILQYAKAHNI